MDCTTFSCCLQKKTTSGVSVWAVLERCSDNSQLSGNYDPLRTACKTCSRNYICRKCKPWRRKSLLSTRPKWTWFNILCSLNLLLLLASLAHAVLNGLSRTMSAKKTSRLTLHFLLLVACFLGGIFLPLASCQESLQSTPSVKISQLNNAVVYVGSAFSYNISTSVFDCEVDSIVVSETADRFLSYWLSYNSEKKQLYGVPSDKDEGTYNILVVALTKDNAVRGHVCGSQSFSIIVVPVSNQLPVSVHFGTGGSRSYHKSSHSLSCLPGMQAVLGTVVLNADMQRLNGHERMVLLSKMADHLKLHTSKVSVFPGDSSHPMTEQLDNLAVMAAGVGDGRFAKGSRSLLTWNIGCGAFKLEDAAFSRLETDSQDGTISALLGFPVVGWHVTSGTQKNVARRRVRRAAGGIGFTPTPTPTATSAPPTRMSNMSTSVVMSRTVTLTSSAVGVISTITLPVSTSVTLSVAPNRTIAQSTGVSINTTILSQSLPRTIQSSTFSINFTVSSQSPNRTDIQSSSLSFSRTVVQSSTVTNFRSSMTSFSPTSILNSSILTGTSSTPALSRNATQFVNRTSSSVTSPSMNLTFTTGTASASISLSVPFISNISFPTTTRVMNSSIVVMSPNGSATFVSSSPIVPSSSMTPPLSVTVLIPSTPQVNSTEVTRTSQFAASSNATTLITSSSLLLSLSLAGTTFQPTSAITVSTSQLNSSTSNVISTLPSPTVITSNSSVTVATTSVLATASVNQTINSSSILSATLARTFSISPTSSLVVLVPNKTSVENVTSSFVTSGLVTSSPTLLSSTPRLESTVFLNRSLPRSMSTFLTTSVVPTMTSTQRSTFATTSSLVPSLNFSSVTMSSSMIQPSSTLVSSSSSEDLNVTYCTNVPTMTSTQRPTFATTSSLVPSLNFSSVTLSSSLIHPLSTLVLSSSSERLNATSVSNVTSVVANITSATLQPSVTSAPSVNISSLTASPLGTTVNLTSVVITVNMSTTKRTALVNSTSISERSTFVTLTTSVRFLPTKTSGARTFPSTFTTNRTVVVSTSGGVDTSSVNTLSTPKSTRTTFLLSSGSSVSAFHFSNVVPSSVLSRSFTKLPNTTFVTVPASSEVRVNSTAPSRTQERSSALTSAVTRLGNSSVSPRRSFSSNTTQVMVSSRTVSSTVFVANSSSVVPSLSRNVTNTSSFLSPSSRSISRSSTILLSNASRLVAVSKTSVTFSSTVTSAESSLVNTSSLISTNIRTVLKSTSLLTTSLFTRNRPVISTSQVSPTMTTPLLNSSLVTSTLKSQSLTILISTSGIVKSSEMLKNSTAVLRTVATVSPSSSALVLVSSSFGINSTLIIETPSVTVSPTSATVLRTAITSGTGIPTSSPIQNTSSFTRAASQSTVSTLLFSPSTMQTEFTMPLNSTQSTRTITRSTRVPHSSSRDVSVSSKLSSFVRSSVTVIPTSRPQVNRTTSILPTSGLTTVTSPNATIVTLRSTEVKMNSSPAPSYTTVGSRMSSVRFSSPQIESTASTRSKATAVTLSKQSTVIVTRSSFKGLSLSSEVTQVNSVVDTSLLMTSKSPVVTQRSSSDVIQSSRTFTQKTSVGRSVTPTRVSYSSVKVTPSSRVFSTVKSSEVDSTSVIRSSRTNLSAVSTIQSRVMITVTSLVAPSVTSDVTSRVVKSHTSSFQTELIFTTLVSKTSPVNVVSTFIPKSISLGSTAGSIYSVTQPSEQLSLNTALPSRSLTVTTLASESASSRTSLAASLLTSSPRISTALDKTAKMTTTAKEVFTSRVTSTAFPSSTLETSTRRITSMKYKTATFLSPFSGESTVLSRFPTISLSAVSFSSSKSGVILNSSFRTSLSLSLANHTRHVTSYHVTKSRNLLSHSRFFTSLFSTTTFSYTNTTLTASKQSPGIVLSTISFRAVSISQTVVLATIPLPKLPDSSTFSFFSRTSKYSSFSFHFSSFVGTIPSSSALFSSNTTPSVTATVATQTVSVLPTSSVPATAQPTSPPNLPPLLLNNIGRVQAPAGKAFQFIIPDDTFYDREDRATTRDLTLSMTLANGSNIPTDFWLQFDIASQTINGLPLDEHVPDGILGQVLVLRARDNNSAETFDAFEVLVVPSETPVVQELRVRITNEFATFNLTLRLAILKKIAAYYDDADESKIRVLTFSPGSVIMTWTNDSLPTDSCDEEKLQFVTNKMLLPNGEVREEFREALQGFPVVSASQERFGVCNGSFIAPTVTPIDPARKETRVEEDLWYKHVLVGLLIVVIIIVLVALLIWYNRRRRPKPVKEKRTFKKRKPIVLGPEIELKPLPGKPLVLPDDDPSLPPSYISETSFNKPTYSDDEDEEDYGKRSPSVVYEPPPPFYPTQDDDPRNSPPPAYLMPPMY